MFGELRFAGIDAGRDVFQMAYIGVTVERINGNFKRESLLASHFFASSVKAVVMLRYRHLKPG